MKKEIRHALTTGKFNFLLKGLFIALVTTAFSLNVFAQEAVSAGETVGKDEMQTVSGKKSDKQQVQVPQQFFSDELITATTYPFTAQNGVALEDMSSGTTQLIAAGLDDNASAVTNIGFDFWYDGVRFTQFSCNANGLCRLGATAVGTGFTNSLATTTDAPKIAPYNDDLWIGTNGNVRFKVVGSAPNRKLVVEWNNMTIPRQIAATTGAGTFQMWLFESTGLIQFVYGGGIILNAANAGYSVGLQAGAATNFASVSTLAETVSYAAANNAQTDAIPSGKSYLFTPLVPAAPTGLTFGTATPTTNTLNWTDNATNEVGYVIYRSTDNITFNFAAQVAANSITFTDTSLTPSTNYFYRVYAVTEGALSSPALAGSQATTAGGSDTCLAAGGDYSNPATWLDNSVPTANDNVTIQSGCTVTVDTAGALALNVTINAGGTLQSPLAGVVTTNNLTVVGSVTNNGTLDFSTNANTSGAILTFGAGGFDVTFGGSGATTDVRAITVAKGLQATVVELTATNFTVQGVNTDVAGYLTLTSGTFKISGTFTMANRTFTTPTYIIPLLGGFWLNNPNYTVAATASGSTTSNNGLFRVTTGIYNIGIGIADQMRGGAGALFRIEGGTINVSGAFDPQSAVTYNQSGGTINVGVVGNNVSNFGTFELFSTASVFIMSGGTINVINPSTGATKVDYKVLSAFANQNVTGGLLVIGATGAPAASIYNVNGATPSITINATMTLAVNAAALFMRGINVINNGTITGIGASPRFDFGSQNSAMTYSGSGIFGTLAVPFGGIGVSANSIFLTTLSSPIICNRVNLFQGGFINSNQITLGNAGVSTTVVQIGSAGLTTPGGSFDVSPVHNAGTGGHILLYAPESVARTTGFEINPTRILASINLIDNINGLIIAGGPLTVNLGITLTNGIVTTSPANVLMHNGIFTRTGTCAITNCFIDGPLRRDFAAIGVYTYHVGEGGYAPVLANVTAVTSAGSLTAESFNATLAGFNPPTSLSRNWGLTETGDLTADLSFTYNTDATDVMGNEADYRVYRREAPPGNTVTNLCPGGPCVNVGTNTLGPIVGVTTFSRWTGAENQTPVAANINIAGRVIMADGISGISKARVTLSGGNLSQPREVMTNPLGYYSFEELQVGQTYILSVGSKQYTFSPSSIILTPDDNVLNADFVANSPE